MEGCDELLEVLNKGLEPLHLQLSEKAKQRLVDYVLLLHKWNKTQNLTSLSTPKAMIKRHVLDSLAIVPHIDACRVLDVGSGAGLPGIPLSIACPDKTVFLLEVRLKRVVFLRQAVSLLALENVNVIHDRLENHHPEMKYDGVVARAFCPPKSFLSRVAHVLDEQANAYVQVGEHEEIKDIQTAGGKIKKLVGVPGSIVIFSSK